MFSPATAQVSLNRQPKESRYVMLVLHYVPERRCETIDIIEDVLPLYHVAFKVRVNEVLKEAYRAPSMEVIEFRQENEEVIFTIPRIDGHAMVVLDY